MQIIKYHSYLFVINDRGISSIQYSSSSFPMLLLISNFLIPLWFSQHLMHDSQHCFFYSLRLILTIKLFIWFPFFIFYRCFLVWQSWSLKNLGRPKLFYRIVNLCSRLFWPIANNTGFLVALLFSWLIT